MDGTRVVATRVYWTVTLVMLGVAIVMAVRAPVEETMGPIQKLFYLHLPVAINTFLSALVVFVACVGYVSGRRQVWDDLAHAAARVTVLNGTVLLITGMFWARIAWGQWWTWSPRLAFSLLLWLLYAVYLSLRPMCESPQRRAIVCAVYGIVAFLDVPLVYLSVKLLPDIHPTAVDLAPEMSRVLLVWFIPITMLTGGLIAARFSLTRQVSREAAEPPSPRTVGGERPRPKGVPA